MIQVWRWLWPDVAEGWYVCYVVSFHHKPLDITNCCLSCGPNPICPKILQEVSHRCIILAFQLCFKVCFVFLGVCSHKTDVLVSLQCVATAQSVSNSNRRSRGGTSKQRGRKCKLWKIRQLRVQFIWQGFRSVPSILPIFWSDGSILFRVWFLADKE